jgi:hypothetical protein
MERGSGAVSLDAISTEDVLSNARVWLNVQRAPMPTVIVANFSWLLAPSRETAAQQ